jgi:hypothetical protein
LPLQGTIFGKYPSGHHEGRFLFLARRGNPDHPGGHNVNDLEVLKIGDIQWEVARIVTLL